MNDFLENLFASKGDSVVLKDMWAEIAELQWNDGFALAKENIDDIGFEDIVFWALVSDDKIKTTIDKHSNDSGQGNPLNNKCLKLLRSEFSIEKEDLLNKISSISKDRGLNFIDILTEAKATANLISTIQKNATKQNTYETTVVKYINYKLAQNVSAFVMQNESLKIRFSENGTPEEDGGANFDGSKSADILVMTSNDSEFLCYLISHKYARVGGGHQSNQIKDAVTFLKKAEIAYNLNSKLLTIESFVNTTYPNSGKSVRWIPALILDGEYCESQTPSLKEVCSSEFFIGNTDEFLNFVRKSENLI